MNDLVAKLHALPMLTQVLILAGLAFILFSCLVGFLASWGAKTHSTPETGPEEEEEEDWEETRADDYDLTVREKFALEFCKGIVQSGEPEDTIHNAVVAVRQANALIEALNDPKLRKVLPPP